MMGLRRSNRGLKGVVSWSSRGVQGSRVLKLRLRELLCHAVLFMLCYVMLCHVSS